MLIDNAKTSAEVSDFQVRWLNCLIRVPLFCHWPLAESLLVSAIALAAPMTLGAAAIEWRAEGWPDELTERFACRLYSEGVDPDSNPVEDEHPTYYQLARMEESWILMVATFAGSTYRPDSKLALRLQHPVAVKVSIDGGDARDFMIALSKEEEDEYGIRWVGQLPEWLSKRLKQDVHKLKMALPAEAQRDFDSPYELFEGIYEWRFDHWTYRVGVAFCERADKEEDDDSWF